MGQLNRRHALLSIAAASSLTSSSQAVAQGAASTEGREIAPGVRRVDYTKRETMIPNYKTVSMRDHIYRTDGTFSRSDFAYDPEQDHYTCPGGKRLVQYRRNFTTPRTGVTKDGVRFYRAKQSDCQSCDLKPRCCPNTPRRRVPRDLDEDARDVARALAGTPAFERSRHHRKKIEMLFAHLKRILRLARLRLRGPNGAKGEFLLAATAQNLRRLAKLRPMPGFAGVGT